MTIILNGKKTEVQPPLTISDLLVEKKLSGKPVAIELNGKALLPQAFAAQTIGADDQIEIIVIAAGG